MITAQGLESGERPLVTFALFAYNQAQFVREAVEGALSQEYSPLEVILSDDCSTDGTFEIMADVARAYRGPHRVLLNRNDPNLGLVPHINKVLCELASSDLLVVAAGDDVSIPTRTGRLHRAWAESGGKALMVSSAMELIDGDGAHLGLRAPTRKGIAIDRSFAMILDPTGSLYGAAALYHRDVFRIFGPLSVAQVEDGPLAIRSQLLGPTVAIPDVLVRKRIAGSNLGEASGGDHRAHARRGHRYRISIYDQAMLDIRSADFARLRLVDDPEPLLQQCGIHRRKHEAYLDLIQSGGLIPRLRAWAELARVVTWRQSLDNLLYLLPGFAYPYARRAWIPAKRALGRPLTWIGRMLGGRRTQDSATVHDRSPANASARDPSRSPND